MIRLRSRGMATLTAVALLLLLTTWLIVSATRGAEVEVALGRSLAQDQSTAWDTLEGALQDLASWRSQDQTLINWLRSHPYQPITWSFPSGQINLNTASPFLLALPELRATLKVSPDEFIERRTSRGLSQNPQSYEDLLRPGALGTWFTTISLWNLNTADEIAVEQMVTVRLGSASMGSTIRAYLRSFRQQTKRLTEADWLRAGLEVTQALDPVVTLEPEIDVNVASRELLQSLLSNPAWGVVDPAGKAVALVEGRDSRPWDPERLQLLLAVPQDNLVLSYLGTSTRFLVAEVAGPRGHLSVTLFLTGDAQGSRKPRIITSEWRTS